VYAQAAITKTPYQSVSITLTHRPISQLTRQITLCGPVVMLASGISMFRFAISNLFFNLGGAVTSESLTNLHAVNKFTIHHEPSVSPWLLILR